MQNMDGHGERFWYDDPSGFMATRERVAAFVPDMNTSLDAQLNAVLRFAIYSSAIVALLRGSVAPLVVVVVAAAAGTLLVHRLGVRESLDTQERMEGIDVERDPNTRRLCTRPTLDNPYMNVLMSDYARFPDRPQACDLTLRDVGERADALHGHNLYVDSDDVYGRRSSSHQFHAMPVTTIPNDQDAFAKWLYSPSPRGRGTCKEGDQDACAASTFHMLPGL
jgi:hypothetical protein